MRKHIKGTVLIGLLALLMVAAVMPVVALAEDTGGVVRDAAAGADSASRVPIDLTPIVQTVITLLASIITVKLVPWIKARTNTAQQDGLRSTARTLVYAAEQIFGSGTGKKKLMYVKAKLREHGYDIDIDVIEAAVKELSMDAPAVIENATMLDEDEDTEPPDDPGNPE